MSIKTANEIYLEQAKQLETDVKEQLLSRMTGKLPRRLEKEKLTQIEAIAIQLELEDEHLQEWRIKFAQINEKMSKKSKSK